MALSGVATKLDEWELCVEQGGDWHVSLQEAAEEIIPELDEAVKIEKEAKLEEEREKSVWRPLFWARLHMMAVYLFMVCVLVIIIEFSYSNMFQNNQYPFLLMIKVINVIAEIILGNVSCDGRTFLPDDNGAAWLG